MKPNNIGMTVAPQARLKIDRKITIVQGRHRLRLFKEKIKIVGQPRRRREKKLSQNHDGTGPPKVAPQL